MKRIIMSGGGDELQSRTVDAFFAKRIGSHANVLYLPVAMERERYPACLEWFTKTYSAHGISSFTMWENLSDKSVADLARFQAIYIGGGNTFKLLKEIKTSGFDRLLREYLESGGIVYGGSAGAIILGHDILTCSHMDRNDVNLSEFDGLNVVHHYSIWCHYTAEDDARIFNYASERNPKIIAIPEESGIYLEDGLLSNIGDQPCYIFEGVENWGSSQEKPSPLMNWPYDVAGHSYMKRRYYSSF